MTWPMEDPVAGPVEQYPPWGPPMVFCGVIFGDISEFVDWAIVAGAMLLAMWSPSTVPDGVDIPCDAIPAPAGDVPPGIAGFVLAVAWELGAYNNPNK